MVTWLNDNTHLPVWPNLCACLYLLTSYVFFHVLTSYAFLYVLTLLCLSVYSDLLCLSIRPDLLCLPVSWPLVSPASIAWPPVLACSSWPPMPLQVCPYLQCLSVCLDIQCPSVSQLSPYSIRALTFFYVVNCSVYTLLSYHVRLRFTLIRLNSPKTHRYVLMSLPAGKAVWGEGPRWLDGVSLLWHLYHRTAPWWDAELPAHQAKGHH